MLTHDHIVETFKASLPEDSEAETRLAQSGSAEAVLNPLTDSGSPERSPPSLSANHRAVRAASGQIAVGEEVVI